MSALVLLLLTAAPSGTATLPLEELVELLKAPAALEPANAGVGVVTSAQVVGRPGEAGLWLDVELTVRVASGDSAMVPVMTLGPEVLVESISDSTDASVVLRDGAVTVSVRGAGVSRVSLKLLVRSIAQGGRMTAKVKLSPAVPPTPLKLDVDDGLFELPGATVVQEWGGYVVFPSAGAYQVTWASKAPVKATTSKLAQRVPVDALVKQATSRWVTTLEGRATHEIKLLLQLDRAGTVTVEVPEGQRLLRARVNGQPIEVKPGATSLQLEVAPATLGGLEATVELVLVRELGVFHLSGRVELAAPRVSWPVSKWTSETVLPRVFTYAREGGSMEQVGAEAPTSGEVPGKSLTFSQHLITASAPLIVLRYFVDLSGLYFR